MPAPVELILQLRDSISQALKKVTGASRETEAALDGVVGAAERAEAAEKAAAAAAARLAADEKRLAKEVRDTAASFKKKAAALGLTTTQLREVERRTAALAQAEAEAAKTTKANKAALLGMTGALQAATLGALGAAAAVAKLSQDQADFVNTINDTARNLGFQSETLLGLSVAAQDAGKDLGGLEEMLASFTTRLADAREGNAEALESFERLGFTRDQLTSFESVDDAFRAVTDRLVGFENRSQAAGAASKLFGEQGSKLFSILQDGTKTLDMANARALDFGVTTSGRSAEAAAAWQVQVTDLKLAYQGLATTFAVEFGPQVLEGIEQGLDLIQVLRGWGDEAADVLATFERYNAFSQAFQAFSDIFEFWRDLFRELKADILDIVEAVEEAAGLDGPTFQTTFIGASPATGDTAKLNGVGGPDEDDDPPTSRGPDLIGQEQAALSRAMEALEVAAAVGAKGLQDFDVLLGALQSNVGDGALTGELDNLTRRLNDAAEAAVAFSQRDQLTPQIEAIQAQVDGLGLDAAVESLVDALEEGAENVQVAIQKRVVVEAAAVATLTGDLSGALTVGLREVFSRTAERLAESGAFGGGERLAAAAAGPVGAVLAALSAAGAASGETLEGEERVSSQAGGRGAEAIGAAIEDQTANILNGLLAVPGLLIEFLPEFAVDLARELVKLPLKLAASVFESLDGLLKKVFGEAWEDVKEFFRELFRQDPDRQEKRQQRREERRADRDKRDGLGFSLAGRAAPERSVQAQIQALVGPQAVRPFEPTGFSAATAGVVQQVDRLAEAGTTFAAAAGGRGGGSVVVNNYGVMTGDPARELNRRERRGRNGYGRGLSPTPFEG